MKKGIHPNYNDSTVICLCGNTWKTRSTRPEIKIEICSACHPLYSGKDVLVDTAGQVDKFKKRLAASAAVQHKSGKTTPAESENTTEETIPTDTATE
ncbi:MAG: 50S ribosomal protein L31 [bacterium]